MFLLDKALIEGRGAETAKVGDGKSLVFGLTQVAVRIRDRAKGDLASAL